MKVFSLPHQVQRWRNSLPASVSIGFVPTMGALHEGHLSLLKRSRKENKYTVASIFVNPLQFGPKEDFKRYPRPLEADQKKLLSEGTDILFSPSADTMYDKLASSRVLVPTLNHQLCGSPQRRGTSHFDGVSTVVAKLFNIVHPTKAYFGMKDFQQLRLLEQMNTDLNFGISIVRCPTVREKDGLAMSSRNVYLSDEERSWAPTLYLALQQGRKLLTSEPLLRPQILKKKVTSILFSIPGVKIDYLELVDAETLNPSSSPLRTRLLAVALFLGKTRLIDNILIEPHAKKISH